jgi:hypothetical protein
MNEKLIWIIASVAVAGLAAGLYFVRREDSGKKPPELQWPAQPPAAEEPKIRHPVPATPDSPDEKPLPALADSDAALQESAITLFGSEPAGSFLVPKDIVRHIVVTIDNLPRKKVAVQMRPVKATEGSFQVAGSEDNVTLSAENYERYAPFVRLVEATDARQLSEVYFHFYPLFQQAYEEQGYPGGYFNDRVVEVIDHLLETPDPPANLKLTQPHVLYEFADPNLENRSAGQKVLLRMGSRNAAAVKAKLREIRAAIAGKTPPPQG